MIVGYHSLKTGDGGRGAHGLTYSCLYCCSISWQCYPLYISLFQPLWCSSNIIGLEAALLVNCLHYVSSNVARVACCNRVGLEEALLVNCLHYVSSNVARVAYCNRGGIQEALLVNCLHYVSSNVARVAGCNRVGIEAALLASCILPCITVSLALCEL